MKFKKCPNCKENTILYIDFCKKSMVDNYCSSCVLCNKGWKINKTFDFFYHFIGYVLSLVSFLILYYLTGFFFYSILFGLFMFYFFKIILGYALALSSCEAEVFSDNTRA